MNLTQYPYDVMTMYGSLQINDLGSWAQCRQMPEADYAIVSLNLSHTPLQLFFSGCMPASCNQSEYNP